MKTQLLEKEEIKRHYNLKLKGAKASKMTFVIWNPCQSSPSLQAFYQSLLRFYLKFGKWFKYQFLFIIIIYAIVKR